MKIKNILLTLFFIGISVAGAVEIPLKNAAFATKGNVITDWFPTSANQKIGSATAIAYKDGKNALKISSSTGTTYFGVWQGGFDLKKFPRPAKDEKLVVTMTFRQKNEKVLLDHAQGRKSEVGRIRCTSHRIPGTKSGEMCRPASEETARRVVPGNPVPKSGADHGKYPIIY